MLLNARTLLAMAALGCLIAGCSPAGAMPATAIPTASPALQRTETPAAPQPTETAEAAATATFPAATLIAEPSITPEITPTSTAAPPEMCSPLAGYSFAELTGIVSGPFAAPAPGKDDGHHGIDLAHYAFGSRTTIAGAPVAAAFRGTVTAAIAGSTPYGNFVILETRPEDLPAWFTQAHPPAEGSSVYHLYAHLQEPPVQEIGEWIECGQTFALVGNSGWSGNYHLHFEIRLGPEAAAFTAMSYYLTTTTAEERSNYERWRFGGEFVPIDPLPVLLQALSAGDG